MYPVHIPPILAPSAVDLSIANAANPNPRTHRWILKSIDLARGSTRTSPSIASVDATRAYPLPRGRHSPTDDDDDGRRMASSASVTITAVDTLRAECTCQMRVVRHCPPETPNHKPGERVVRARDVR